MMTTLRTQVLGLPFMEGVPDSIGRDVVDAGRMLEIPAGEAVFSEGQPALAFSVILSGSAKLVQLSSDGDAIVFRVLGVGDTLGSVALLGAEAYPVSAIAVTPLVIVEWPGAVMRQFLEREPHLSLNILRIVSDRLQALRLQYRQLATERVERRVARALLKLIQRAGTPVDAGVLLDLPLSREDLAQLTGTTVYTVSRIISRWEASGWLRSGRQQLVIRDAGTLQMIADQDS